jgi:hypothetical protein
MEKIFLKSNLIAAEKHEDKYCKRNVLCLNIKTVLKMDCFKAWKTLGKRDANISCNYEKKILAMLMA